MGEVNNIRIACWNTRGYLSSIPYIKKLLNEVDVLAISEHWLHSNRLNILDEISDSHHVFARSSNASSAKFYGSRRGQGGVAIFWPKNAHGFSRVSDIIHDRACVVRYQPKDGNVYFFISVYLPAQGCDEDLSTILDEISEIVETREAGSHIIILGDFNGDVGILGGARGTRPPTDRGRYVMNFFNRHGFIATNMLPMAHGPIDTFECHNGHSTIDYIAIPAYLVNDVTQCYVNTWEALNTSDHRDLHLSLNLTGSSDRTQPRECIGKIKWDKQEVRRQYYENMQIPVADYLDRISRDVVNINNLDRLFQEITDIIHDSSANLTRSKYVKHVKPYWNKELTDLKREKIRTYRRWVAAGRPRDPDDPLMKDYKMSKKNFSVTIKRLAKQYEADEVCKAAKLAEVNMNSFWRLIKRCRNSNSSPNISIRKPDGKVVNEVNEVLDVWRTHFTNLGTPKTKPNFDDAHFRAVTDFAKQYNEGRYVDDNFLNAPFTNLEIELALKNLNLGKAAGFDMVTAEHFVHAGRNLIDALRILYNAIVTSEYIPSCFRTGVQIPLFKGKDLDILDPNNYRGITLLSTFNKIFEILIWGRLKGWWKDENIICELQGACKKGLSCIHTAFMLQETVATSMEANGKCFVAFFDVAKAFDTVWIDGLFKQIFDKGITGKTWRLLYRGYVDFQCRVRIGGDMSASYPLSCGIHQGGYLSLLKYTVFINTLLTRLRDSNLCAKIYMTPSTPQGYADDLAACSLTKRKLDAIMDIVYEHGCTWRYDFNARKSGILVYGENRVQHQRNSVHRSFKLGPARVLEVTKYDHVGINTSIFHDNTSGIEERIGKARRALNATSGIGIRRKGLNIATCCVIFWTIIVPIALYGSELWRLCPDSINMLDTFQNYAGKKIQRFYSKIPNVCSFFGLGWMRLVRIVQVRKMLFIQSILSLDEDNLSRKIFIERATAIFDEDVVPHHREWSIVDDLLQVVDIFNMRENVMNMVLRGHMYPKSVWKRMVWERGWSLDDTFWSLEARLHKELDLLVHVCSDARYLSWWNILIRYPEMIYISETMARIVSHASLLKIDDVRLKRQPRSSRVCTGCEMYVIEDIYHIVMQCPRTEHLRRAMFDDLNDDPAINGVLTRHDHDILYICLGKNPNEPDLEVMERLWCISGWHIGRIYEHVLRLRTGVG